MNDNDNGKLSGSYCKHGSIEFEKSCDIDSNMSTNYTYRCHPLRIQQDSQQAYMVHCSDLAGQQFQGHIQHPLPDERSEDLKGRGALLQELYDRLGQSTTWYQFQRIVANIRYYQSMLLQEMERLIMTPLMNGTALHRWLQGFQKLQATRVRMRTQLQLPLFVI